MTVVTIGNKTFSLRKADAEQDFEWAYGIFKANTKNFVEALTGKYKWTDGGALDKRQRGFFRRGFGDDETQIIIQAGRRLGFFCISEEDSRIVIQRSYRTPELNGVAFGRWIAQQSLIKAHKVRKPLEAEILTSNERATRFCCQHMGFKIVGTNNYSWVRQNIVRHQETALYALQHTLNSDSPKPPTTLRYF